MTSATDPIDREGDPSNVDRVPAAARWTRQPHVFIDEFDIADGVPSVPAADPSGRRWTAGQLLVRCFTEPVGLIHLDIPLEGVPQATVAAALEGQLGDRVRTKLQRSGIEVSGPLPKDGLPTDTTPTYLEGRRQAQLAGPAITVVICTRGRPEMLRDSLESLGSQEYQAIRVLVVDNAPTDAETRRVASDLSRKLDLDYIVEPRPGLSWARNRAIDASSSEIIAWLDDDEKADRWWAAEIARAFFEHPEAGAVSGITLPAEIESQAQLWFEENGGHHKGRDFDSAMFSPATRRTQSPLYPYPQFGTGGNMAFRREAIEAIGRFDTALGAGTVAMGGEDTAAFSEHLYAGGTLVYHPPAVIWHTHRSDMQALRELKRGYGRGITAFYLSFLLRHPESLSELVRLFPRAIRHVAPAGNSDSAPASAPNEVPTPSPPLAHELYRGLLEGMPMYVLARHRARQIARSEYGR